MILADTSIWVDFIRGVDQTLTRLLNRGEVLMHPVVMGELAVGDLRRRATFLEDLRSLPRAQIASHDEVMGLIERERLFGLGLRYGDVHLLASTRLSADARLLSKDGRLAKTAERFGVAAIL